MYLISAEQPINALS